MFASFFLRHDSSLCTAKGLFNFFLFLEAKEAFTANNAPMRLKSCGTVEEVRIRHFRMCAGAIQYQARPHLRWVPRRFAWEHGSFQPHIFEPITSLLFPTNFHVNTHLPVTTRFCAHFLLFVWIPDRVMTAKHSLVKLRRWALET